MEALFKSGLKALLKVEVVSEETAKRDNSKCNKTFPNQLNGEHWGSTK